MQRPMSPIRALVLILAISSLAFAAGGEWKRIDTGTMAWLRAISFANERVGWIGGSAGTLLKTEDGGKTWARQKSPTADNIRDIVFKGDVGWLLCERDVFGQGGESPTYILKTDDGGETWGRAEVAAGRERMLRFVTGPDGTPRFAVGEMGTMLYAAPGPETAFARVRLASRAMLTAGQMLDERRGLLVGGAGTIMATEDGAETWDAVPGTGPANMQNISSGYRGQNGQGTPTRLNALFFLDQERGWAAGNNGTLLQTRNGGKSWSRQESGVEVMLLDILFLDEKTGFAAGDDGTMISTEDGGQTWKKDATGTRHRLERLAVSADAGLVIGFGGTVLHRPLPR
ncbi:MAG TPA: YCF48-related protein [Pyrinomonadaceae bacterium]|nr:YCF48-related protein [Pyrinomonadaceae bacterium]